MVNRLDKFDNVKGFLIYCVVFGHFLEYFTSNHTGAKLIFFLIYTFHMPLFIFLSGLFSKKLVNSGKYAKIIGFGLLYVLFKLGFSLFRVIALNKAFNFNLFTESGIPWYLLTVIFFPLVTRLIKNASPKIILPLSLALALIIGYSSAFGDFLAISRLIVFYPVYYLGYVLNPEKVLEFTSSKKIKLAAFTILTALAIFTLLFYSYLSPLSPLLSGRNSYEKLKEGLYLYGPLLRSATYLIFTVCSFCVLTLVPSKFPLNILSYIGKRTLPVYVFHIFFIQLILHVFGTFAYINSLPWIISIPLMAVLALGITLLTATKPFNSAVNFICTLPKKFTEKVTE